MLLRDEGMVCFGQCRGKEVGVILGILLINGLHCYSAFDAAHRVALSIRKCGHDLGLVLERRWHSSKDRDRILEVEKMDFEVGSGDN